MAVVHPDRGETDAVMLSFLDHGTFHRRDEATDRRPTTKHYATFDKYDLPGRPPWGGAVTTGLRDAIERYATVWFPGAWAARRQALAIDCTVHRTPGAPVANAARGR